MELKIFGKYMLGLTAIAALVCLIDECARRDEWEYGYKAAENRYQTIMDMVASGELTNFVHSTADEKLYKVTMTPYEEPPRENDTAYNDTETNNFTEVDHERNR